MRVRRWTVLVVPHGSGASKSVGLSRRSLRILVALVTVVSAAALLVAYTAISKSVDRSRLKSLERTNSLLAQELDRTSGLIDELSSTVATITERDRQVRLLAGLEPTDPDVLQAGVGGPASRPTEGERFLRRDGIGRQALQMRFDLAGLLRRSGMLASSFREAADSLERHVDRYEHTPSIGPVAADKGYFSSPFTSRRIHPIHGRAQPHLGIDVFAPSGTPILATAAGKVIDVRNTRGSGNVVKIAHGYGIVTKYAHCSQILVRVGQLVTRHDPVALVGNTGISTGPHVHYEVIVNGDHVNPQNYIFPDQVVD